MIDFLKKSTWSFSSIVIKSICSLATNKLFAIYFGATGITLLAHFQNLISLVTQVPNDGINRGIIKYWSGDNISPVEKQKYLKAGFFLNIGVLVITLILLFLFRSYFFRDFNFYFNTTIITLLILGITLYIVHLLLLSIILSFQRIKVYAIINAVGSILVVITILIVAPKGNLNYALLSFLIAQSFAVIFSLIYGFLKGIISPVKGRISWKDFRKLGGFALMALSILVFGKVTDFVIRDYAIQSFGMLHTGLWQSVVKLSDGYMMLFINTVGIVYYPQVSSMVFNTDDLRQYLRDVFKIVVIISVTGLFLIYIFREPILMILYDREFIPAGDLMPLQFLGDFFCIIAYLLTYIISAQARSMTFILLQAASAIFYIILVYALSSYFGIEGIPAAHAIRYFVLAIILIILNKRILF
jgi:O-antigen/teichoic acid export membrane protein